jgi:hypothetical protein
MKKLLLILLLSPLFTLAQDTIKLPTPVAKQVVKDLVSYDSLKAVHTLTVEQLTLTEKKVEVQSNIIKAHEAKFILCEQRVEAEQGKYQVMTNWVEDLKKQNKKFKVDYRFLQIVGTAVVGGFAYLYITK